MRGNIEILLLNKIEVVKICLYFITKEYNNYIILMKTISKHSNIPE